MTTDEQITELRRLSHDDDSRLTSAEVALCRRAADTIEEQAEQLSILRLTVSTAHDKVEQQAAEIESLQGQLDAILRPGANWKPPAQAGMETSGKSAAEIMADAGVTNILAGRKITLNIPGKETTEDTEE